MPRPRSEDPFVATIRLVFGVTRRMRCRVALIGGFALPFHGVQRATGDVNFLVDARAAASRRDPRRLQDEADIQALFDAGTASLDLDLLRDYFQLFERAGDLDRLLAGTTKREPRRVPRERHPIAGPRVERSPRSRSRVRDLDEFIEFLRRLRALFGPVDRPRRRTDGGCFRL
jgi:hypothetical protein